MVTNYLKRYRNQIIFVGLLLMFFPVILNYFVFNWSAKGVNGEINSWIGFSLVFMVIFGGLIGGLFTFLGVKMSLNHEKEIKEIESYPIKIMKLYNMEKVLFDFATGINDQMVYLDRNKFNIMLSDLLVDSSNVNAKAFKFITEIDRVFNNKFSSLQELEFKYKYNEDTHNLYWNTRRELYEIVLQCMSEFENMKIEYQVELDNKEQ